MAFDGSNDWTVWDGSEQIRFESQLTPGQYFPVLASLTALRGQVERVEAFATAGVYSRIELPWWLPGPLLVTPPKPADQIVDTSGTIWTILTVGYDPLDQLYDCNSIDLVLTYGLSDTITVQRAAISYDAAGGVVRTWSGAPYVNVPARVQLLTQQEQEERAVRGMKGTYAIIVGQQVTLTAEDRIAWTPLGGSQVLLNVIGQHNPQRIDELPVLDAVLAV